MNCTPDGRLERASQLVRDQLVVERRCRAYVVLVERHARDEAVDHRPVEPVLNTIGARLAPEHGDVEQQRALARESSCSTLVIRNRRHAGAASVRTAPSGRPPGRLSTVIARRST